MKYLISILITMLGWFYGVKGAVEFLFPELMASEYAKSVPLLLMIGVAFGAIIVTVQICIASMSIDFKKITKE